LVDDLYQRGVQGRQDLEAAWVKVDRALERLRRMGFFSEQKEILTSLDAVKETLARLAKEAKDLGL